jgi:hypothetical protein
LGFSTDAIYGIDMTESEMGRCGICRVNPRLDHVANMPMDLNWLHFKLKPPEILHHQAHEVHKVRELSASAHA